MKKIYLFLLFVIGFTAFSQQKGFSYQAVIINPNSIAAPGYNGTSMPLANKSICLSFQIVNSVNQVEYQESQSITTDVYGMVNLVIGAGTPAAGLVSTLDGVSWSQGNKKLIVAVNTEGVCSNYTEISNQVLNYTPYSFYAQNADLKDGYITTAKLADGAVTDAKVATGINPSKVGLGNVNNTSDANKPVSTATQTALNLKESLINKSTDIATDANSTTKYPSVKAIKDYVDSHMSSSTIVDADATTRGKIQLAGDLSGTATVPTVPGLALKANLASPTFIGTVTSPIYASTPQILTPGATISWNPANGLNTNVTLDQNSTLSFSSNPAAGSYGTLVITQDATGGRTITLPSTANKVLGSTSTTTIALSSAANAKDILNFYYDGTNCYWNIGQGYGTAAVVASSTANLASGVTGTLAVANGGTGATTATTALANLTGTQAANKVLAGPATNLLTLASYDGTSLTGWTATGGASIDAGTFKVNGGNQSMFRDLGQNFKNKTVQFDVKITAGTTGFTVGAAADGSGGLGVTLRAGASNLNGLRSTTNWFYTNAGGDTFTFTAGTWYTIKIVTDNGAAAGTSWYINGVLAGNSGGYFIDNGTYFGIASDNATANFDNISISGVSNATDATPTFRTLVAADIPILNQNTTGNAATATTATTATNVTGTVAVTNGGTGATTKTTAFDALSPMTTAGDIIYGGLNGTGTRLPKGNNGEFLKLSSGVPVWGSPFSGMGSLDFLGANNRLNVYGNSFEMFGTDSILLNPGTDGQVYIDTYSNGARVATRDYADTKAPLYANINNKSASYTLDASDNGKVLTFDNTSPMSLTVPTGLAAGFNCMIVQKGAGIVTISAAGGVTVINRSGGTKTAGQNAMVTLIALSGAYFISGGDMQ